MRGSGITLGSGREHDDTGGGPAVRTDGNKAACSGRMNGCWGLVSCSPDLTCLLMMWSRSSNIRRGVAYCMYFVDQDGAAVANTAVALVARKRGGAPRELRLHSDNTTLLSPLRQRQR